MLGIKFAKFDPSFRVFLYRKRKKETTKNYKEKGHAFFYFAPTATIIAIPTGKRNTQFQITTMTRDCQTVSLLIQIIYSIKDSTDVAGAFDFSLDKNLRYQKDSLAKIDQLLKSKTKAFVSSTYIRDKTLSNVLAGAKGIIDGINKDLREGLHKDFSSWIEIADAYAFEIKPCSEIIKAYEETEIKTFREKTRKA